MKTKGARLASQDGEVAPTSRASRTLAPDHVVEHRAALWRLLHQVRDHIAYITAQYGELDAALPRYQQEEHALAWAIGTLDSLTADAT